MEENGIAVQKVDINKTGVESIGPYADVNVLHQLALKLNLNSYLASIISLLLPFWLQTLFAGVVIYSIISEKWLYKY